MDELEDSTLDLIYRRCVHPLNPAYMVILVITASLAVLPFVRVNRVVNSRGIIRPLAESVEICPLVDGIIDSTILVNNLMVVSGDTVVWLRQDIPEARILEFENMIENNRKYIADISQILSGKTPEKTGRFIQSHLHHETALSYLLLQKEFMEDEYTVSEKLFREEVIPYREFARVRSEYQLVSAKVDDMEHQYRNSLEEELADMQLENRRYESEITLIRTSMAGYYAVASVGGSVQNCTGISAGSVVRAGMSLAVISPSGMLAAECYLETGSIPLVEPGTPVRLTFDGTGNRNPKSLDTRVEQVDNDIMMMEGTAVLRVRCVLDETSIKKGMTFTASFLLTRESLASMILEWADLRFNPLRTQLSPHE